MAILSDRRRTPWTMSAVLFQQLHEDSLRETAARRTSVRFDRGGCAGPCHQRGDAIENKVISDSAYSTTCM
jgi:hypothetical protein